MIGLDDLRKALLSEREAGKLLQIPPDFYSRAHEALQSLRSKAETAEDPFSDDVQKMILETRSIEQTIADLFAIRAGKILSLAESQGRGQYIDREEVRRMIPPEREMFRKVTEGIISCQEMLVQGSARVHHPLTAEEEGPAAAPEYGPAAPGPEPAPPETVPAQPAPQAPSYALVRVLADMDAFMGIDGRTYDLAKGDIVMLPERNAEVLVGRNIALTLRLPTIP